MTTLKLVPALVLGALFSVPALGGDAVVKATLAEVQKTPQAFLKTRFEFEGRFDGLGQIYQPFFTIFDDYRYVNASVWGAEQNLAKRAEYTSNFPLIYMRRDESSAMENMFALKKYQRFKAIGMVQSVFGDRPFVELLDLVPLDEELCAKEHLLQAVSASDVAMEVAAAKMEAAARLAQQQAEIIEAAAMAATPEVKETSEATESTPAEEPAQDAPKAMPAKPAQGN